MKHRGVSFPFIVFEYVTQQSNTNYICKNYSKYIEQQIHIVTRAIIGQFVLQVFHKPTESSRNKEHRKERLDAVYTTMTPEELKPYDGTQSGIHNEMHHLVHMLKKRQ